MSSIIYDRIGNFQVDGLLNVGGTISGSFIGVSGSLIAPNISGSTLVSGSTVYGSTILAPTITGSTGVSGSYVYATHLTSNDFAQGVITGTGSIGYNEIALVQGTYGTYLAFRVKSGSASCLYTGSTASLVWVNQAS